MTSYFFNRIVSVAPPPAPLPTILRSTILRPRHSHPSQCSPIFVWCSGVARRPLPGPRGFWPIVVWAARGVQGAYGGRWGHGDSTRRRAHRRTSRGTPPVGGGRRGAPDHHRGVMGDRRSCRFGRCWAVGEAAHPFLGRMQAVDLRRSRGGRGPAGPADRGFSVG